MLRHFQFRHFSGERTVHRSAAFSQAHEFAGPANANNATLDARSDELAPAERRGEGAVLTRRHGVWQAMSSGSGCGHRRSPFASASATLNDLAGARGRGAARATRGGWAGPSAQQTRRGLATFSPCAPAGERAARSLGVGLLTLLQADFVYAMTRRRGCRL
jgi:hypothetical protein